MATANITDALKMKHGRVPGCHCRRLFVTSTVTRASSATGGGAAARERF
jgi:hypothetical protein